MTEASGTRSDLHADYARAGFSGSLGTGKVRALVLVDLTYAYLDEASPLYAGPTGPAVVEASAQLLAAARRGGSLVVHTRVELQTGGHDGGLFRRKVPALQIFENRGHFDDVPAPLKPVSDEILIRKQYASAFFGTSLASTLTAARVDTLVIGGASTSGCVRATAVDALQHGFVPLVVAEACLDRDPRPHEATLFDLGAKYADLIDISVACALLRRASAGEA